MLIKSVSGIRGIVGRGLDPELVMKTASRLSSYLDVKKIFLGRDARISGETLRHAVISGIMGTGVDVIDLGMVPTPTLTYNVKNTESSGGIIITASHNPPQWNALKLVGPEGEFLKSDESREFFSLENKKPDWKSYDNLGNSISDDRGADRHIEGVFGDEFICPEEISRRNFKVAIDCINGAGSRVYPYFLEKLGCRVSKIYCDGSGSFSRKPTPSPENLKDLEKLVISTDSDIGFATDPDGDRLSIVMNNGVAVNEELTIVLVTDFILEKDKGPVVINQSTTRSVEDIASRYGVDVHRSPVGEANVVSLMKEKKAIIGGEGNGGIINNRVQYTRDAMSAMAIILQYLTERKIRISDIINEFPRYKMIKKAIKMENKDDRKQFINNIKKKHQGEKINLSDGIRIEYDSSWVHVRMSGTEPVIRVIAEASTEKEAVKLVRQIKEEGKK